MANVIDFGSKGYAIERRGNYGWELLRESTAATNFVMGPRLFASREVAEEHMRNMIGLGWAPEALRVVVAERVEVAS